MRRRLLLSCGFVVLAACGGSGGGSDGAATATGRFGSLHTELCRAVGQARDGELTAAQATFDDIHLGLHDLATAAGEADRTVAARFLEAKQRVETRLDADTLESLVPPLAKAVVATGGTAPATCG